MAIAVAVGPNVGGITSGNTTFTVSLLGTSAGQSIVVGLAFQSAFTSVTSVACSGESNLTLDTVTVTANSSRVQLAYLANITAGGDKTLTVTMSHSAPGNNYAVAFAAALSGTDTTSFFDTSAGSTATSSSPSTSVTTTNANAAVFAIAVADSTSSGDFTAGSGFTLISTADSANRQFNGEYDVDVGAAGAKTVSFGLGGSQTWGVRAAAFNPQGPGSEGTAEPSLPLFTVEADSGETLGTANLQPPLFTVFAEDGTHFDIPLFATSAAGLTGEDAMSGEMSLPQFTMEAAGTPGESAVFDMPLFTVEADGVSTVVATLDRGLLPLFSVEADGVTEGLGTAAVELPLFTTSGGNEAGAEFELPLFDLQGVGAGGTVAEADFELPLFSTSAAGDVVNILTAQFSLPLFSVAASATPGAVGTADADLRLFTLEADGATGTAGTASISIPLFAPTAAGTTPSFGTASIALPLFAIEAIGTPTFASTWRTWVLNLHTRALTEYTGFQFNSYARFAGYTLAASDGGVFKLDTTRNDAGTDIDAVVRTGQLDYDVSWLKRVPRLYVDYSTDGDVDVSTITSESGRRRYLLRHNNVTGIQQRRVPIGKGPKSRHWQFEIANRNGADFSINSFIAYPVVLGRRGQ